MSEFKQALRSYRGGALPSQSLLSRVDSWLAQPGADAVAFIADLDEEHSHIPLPADMHAALLGRFRRALGIAVPVDPLAPEPVPPFKDPDSATITLGTTGQKPAEPAREEPSQDAQVKPQPSPKDLLGQVLHGRFKLVGHIGEGGMSNVYKAIDRRKVEARVPDPFVAVKILTVPFADYSGSLSLLLNEAQKLQRLAHPNIVRVMDCDRDGHTVFMTMEYLSGEPLKRKLMVPDFHGMSQANAVHVIESIGAALAFAHRNGIVHGDLKPGNVIITEQGDVKVIDFGIARAIAQSKESAAGMGAAGKIPASTDAVNSSESVAPWSALSPPYASPEMLEGGEPDPRDDLYALACIAYEILTGEHPFERRIATAARDAALKPERRGGISRRQFKAIAGALEFERSKRTASIEQFLAEFSARPSGSARRYGVVGALGLLVVLGALYLLYRNGLPHIAALTGAKSATAVPGSQFRDCAACPLLTVLPAGRFEQGSRADEPDAQAAEQPKHPVTIAHAIAMGVDEVDVAEFTAFVNQTGRKLEGCTAYDGSWANHPELNWAAVGFPQTPAHPVVCVSWDDAVAYTQWLSLKTRQRYRLPSASEWEYGARAGADISRPWGSRSELACTQANVADQTAADRYPGWSVHQCRDGYVFTAPVGSFAANSFGLHDMFGNAFEWVGDCWHDDYRNAPADGSAWLGGDCSQHEMRGGSWFTTPPYVRAGYRNRFEHDYRATSVGFRVVREIAP